jgi:hypothetical protein
MFKVNWEEIAEREFSLRITAQLNDLINKRFQEDKALRDNLAYLTVQSLDFGSTPPIFKIINICEAPEEEQFEARRKKILEQKNLERDLDETRDTIIIPGLLNARQPNDFGPSATFRHFLKQRSMEHHDSDNESDRFSVISGGSFMAAILQQQLTSNSASPVSPASLTSSKRKITSRPTPTSPMIPRENALSSLEKPLLPTHICSIGTIYKKKKKTDKNDPDRVNITQTKRRSDWWKNRIDGMKGTDTSISNALTSAVRIPEKHLRPPTKGKKKSIIEDLPHILGEGLMLTFQVTYNGNAHLQVDTEILINEPVPRFLSLPIDVTLSHLNIDAKLNIIFRPATSEVVAFCDDEPDAPIILKDLILAVAIGAPLAHEPTAQEDFVFRDRGKIENLVKDVVQFFAREHVVYPNVIRHTIQIEQ